MHVTVCAREDSEEPIGMIQCSLLGAGTDSLCAALWEFVLTCLL